MTTAQFLDISNVLLMDEEKPTLLLFGIDRLSAMEELFGTGFAEDVAREVTARIEAVLPDGVRLEPENNTRFLVRLPDMTEAALVRIVESAQAAVAFSPVETGHGPVGITISAGAGRGDFAGRALQEPAARIALRAAHGDGIGGFRVERFANEVSEGQEMLMNTSRAMMGALDQGHLVAAYQPVVRADAPDIVSFYECPARIREPNGTVVPAAKFIPAAERLGLAPLIDRQMLMLAMDTLTRSPSTRLSINIFPETMQDAQWLSLFDKAVRADEGLADRLIVEVAETAALLDADRTQRFIDRLREYGVALAMDDFGAGHSSFAHLRQMRFDILKIDGQFVDGLLDNPDCAFFIEKLVDIAGHFDMMSVAEFVEGQGQADRLTELGVEAFQGYLYGAPSLTLDRPMAVRAEARA